jgi:serine protease Do
VCLPAIAGLMLAAGAGNVGADDAANPNLALARQLNEAFVAVAEKVSPSVVVITVTGKGGVLDLENGDGSDGQQNPSAQLPPELRRFLESRKSVGQGSGIIIRPDGFILTNGHVVENAEKIEVRLRDGRTFEARVRGVDAPSDVAVIKIDARDLPVARLADSDQTRVGEFAIAIGAPFALDYTVTFGHVSAKDRSKIMDEEQTEGMTDQSFIQTDANINPGNSGGPLVNVDGEVIGINTLIRGLHTGIGFAIPSNLAHEIADQLIDKGSFSRSWLGVNIVSLREFPAFHDLVPGAPDGVVVDQVLSDGPSAKSDLQPADVVTAIDGKPVVTSEQLKEIIRNKKPGSDVTLSVYRQVKDQGRQLKIVVNPGDWHEPAPVPVLAGTNAPTEATENALGIALSNSRRRLHGLEGVVVSHVEHFSLAERNGLETGDIITSVGGKPVTSPREFDEALKGVDVKKGVMLAWVNEHGRRFAVMQDDGN